MVEGCESHPRRRNNHISRMHSCSWECKSHLLSGSNWKHLFWPEWNFDRRLQSRLSHSLSSPFHVDISDSGSAEEMDQKHCKLGSNPNGVLMLTNRYKLLGRIWVTHPLRHPFHREETSDAGESSRHRQSEDWCQNNQVLESKKPIWSSIEEACYGVYIAYESIWRNDGLTKWDEWRIWGDRERIEEQDWRQLFAKKQEDDRWGSRNRGTIWLLT